MPSPGPSQRLLRWGLVAVAALLVVSGGAVAFVLANAPRNVSHPNIQFTAPTTMTAPAPRPRPRRVVDRFQWPWYGYDAGRTRFFAAPASIAPPLRVGWRFFDGALLEFPPVILHRTMFLLDDDCSARAIDTVTGHVLWKRKLGTLCAASPAVLANAGLVMMPVLSVAGHAPGGGRFVALSISTGRIRWSAPVPPGSESSPIVGDSSVYYGDQSGALVARRVADGRIEWTYRASGAIKGGPALVGGVLYFGDYAGRAYAVRARDGHQIWAVSTNGAQFGFGSGQFYATPAVAYGRVYMGNTDGRVYSFGARNGALAWATSTGAYVYSSAAVADPAGLGPTVYLGSYSGYFYAFNAQSGQIRWKHPAGGRISGAATVVGNVVYYSDLGTRTTTGLNAATGRTVFSFPDGAFTPIIADNRALYLDGYTRIYELLPARRQTTRTGASATGSHGRRKAARPSGKRIRSSGKRTTRSRKPRARQRSAPRRGKSKSG